MNLIRFRFNISRIAEREENALLVERTLLDTNTSHLYSFDSSITTEYDGHLSRAVEDNVVNHLIELLVWADNVRRGYRHGADRPLQVRNILTLKLTIGPIHAL